MVQFTEIETRHLIFAVLVLTIVFAFDDGNPTFELTSWLQNALLVLVLVTAVLLLAVIIQKKVGKRLGAKVEYRLWRIERYFFTEDSKIKQRIPGTKMVIRFLPLGVIIPLLITLFSFGQVKIAAAGAVIAATHPAYRLGRKYAGLSDWEAAQIAVAGPLSLAVLALILQILPANIITTKLMTIAATIALSTMIPLPRLDGSVAFFSSKPFYLFSLIFIVVATLLLRTINSFLTLVIAAILGAIVLLLYYYFLVFTPK